MNSMTISQAEYNYILRRQAVRDQKVAEMQAAQDIAKEKEQHAATASQALTEYISTLAANHGLPDGESFTGFQIKPGQDGKGWELTLIQEKRLTPASPAADGPSASPTNGIPVGPAVQ